MMSSLLVLAVSDSILEKEEAGYQKNNDRVNSFLLENSSWTSVYSNCYRRNRGLVLKVAYKQINNELLLCNLDFLS